MKAFGVTVSDISNDFPKQTKLYEKKTFSMLNEEADLFLDAHPSRKTVVLFGIEAHVCI